MPNTDSQSYTARDIARIITAGEFEGEFEKRLRQVRHWTDCNYLHPIGKKHTGTGVARRYGPDEVRKAAIMRELARFGMTISQIDPEGDGLDFHMERDPWEKAVAGEAQVFLEIVTSPDGGLGWNIVDDPKIAQFRFLGTPGAAAAEMPSSPGTRFAQDAVSGLRINLTKLFAQLDL